MRSRSPFASALASARDQIAEIRSRERRVPSTQQGRSSDFIPELTYMSPRSSKEIKASSIPKSSAHSDSARNGRCPSPHLRGNAHIASAMRSELQQHSQANAVSLVPGPSTPREHPSSERKPPRTPREIAERTIPKERLASMEQMLESMGFTNRAVNQNLLQKYDYQLDKVLEELIGNIGKSSLDPAFPRTTYSKVAGSPPTPPRPSDENGYDRGDKTVGLVQLLQGFSCMEGATHQSFFVVTLRDGFCILISVTGLTLPGV